MGIPDLTPGLQFRLAKREWLLSAVVKLEKGERQVLFSAIEVIKRLAES
jgi:hypothetical protein